jgi:hypothetical protein
MTEMSQEKMQAVQRVVEHVESWEYSAEDDTVENRLREGLGQAGVELEDGQVRQLVDAISHGQGPVHADQVLS